MVGATLSFPVDGAERLAFRALTGADERDAAGDATALLRRLAVPGPGLVAGKDIDRISVGDRDRALAELYRARYGARIVADTTCTECGKGYELLFKLDALAAARQPDGSAQGTPAFVQVGRSRYHLPMLADLYGTPDELLERLHLDGPPAAAEEVDAALEAADPALALDLSGSCPECGNSQSTPFSINGFFSAALTRDSAFLLHEIHLIARSYAWDLNTILGLTRDERQVFVKLILAEADTRRGVRTLAS